MSQFINTSVALQKSIKDNSSELQDFIADLHNWERDVKDQEKRLSPGHDVPQSQDIPPVRCKDPQIVTKKMVIDDKKRPWGTETKKDRISSFDYAAWDKYAKEKVNDSESDSEEEEEEEEEEEMPSQGKNKTQNSTTSSIETPSINLKERAAKLKDDGNKCYSIGALEQAVAKYTQGMALDPTNPILPANRAMAYIKLEKYGAAEADCNRCLRLDASYIKAYLRRGTARIKLQKFKLAVEDFKKVLELEPWNKDAKRELEKLDVEMEGKTNNQCTESLKNQANIQKPRESETSNQNNRKADVKDIVRDVGPQKESNALSKTISTGKTSKSKKEHGKKIKIQEIDSNKNHPLTETSQDYEEVTPIEKLPHQRSRKPMRQIQVFDVTSEELISKDLLSSNVSEDSNLNCTTESSNKSINSKLHKGLSGVTKPHQSTENLPVKCAPVKLLPPVPRTSHQFTQNWQRLIHHKTQAVEYVKAIPPPFFQSIDLESDVLVDFVSALTWEDFSSEQAVSYLGALTKSSGFSVNVMFLDSSQKKVFYDVIEKCKDHDQLKDLLPKLKKCLQ